MNHKNEEGLLSKNIFDYLQQLTCRLVDVGLSADGIVTSGRLWRLHKAVDAGLFTSNVQPEWGSVNGLNRYQRSRLRQLSEGLRLQRPKKLANDLDNYLHEDAKDRSYPWKQYKNLMVEVVVEAIRNRKMIDLGCLVGHNPYRGIFVTDAALEVPSYAFTAWSRAGSGGKVLDEIQAERLLDKIGPLEVNVEDLRARRV